MSGRSPRVARRCDALVPTSPRRARLDLAAIELELLRLRAGGLSNAQAGRTLHLSERTVRRRIETICARLGVGSVIEAVVLAVRAGVL